jgi:hypothetical protein
MPCSRNVIIPLWFATFALAVFVLPLATVGGSLFVLGLGLAVPVMIYVLWRDPSLQPVSTERQRTDSQRTRKSD